MQNLGTIFIYIFAGIGVLISLIFLIMAIWVAKIIIPVNAKAKKFKKAVLRTRDPAYADDVKDKLKKYHTDKFINSQSKCCGEEDANKMLFERKYKRSADDNRTGSREERTKPSRGGQGS